MAKSDSMKYVVLLLCIVASVLGGLWYLSDEGIPEEGKFVLTNNPDSIDFRTVPPTYETVDATLLRRPLELANPSSQSTKFSKVSDSGIKFENYFDRNRPLELVDTGSGVAIGDYDNDGLNDVYLVGSDVGNRLFRNLGNFKFEDQTLAAGVDGKFMSRNLWGSGATFADVDNDGDLDLFVCNMAAPNLLYINQGDGTFLEQSYLRGCNYIGASKSANFCDYDRDGDLDFYLVTYQDQQPDRSVDPVEIVNGKKQIREDMRESFMLVGEGVVKAGESDILYRNDGNGSFEIVTENAGLVDYGTSLASVWLDYNNDGWQDIYVSNDFHSPDRLYQNNGDGTFTDVLPQSAKHTPWFSMGNDAGDLNNDGWDDILTADMAGTSHYRRKVDMGDMGDSAFFLEYGAPRQYMKNALFINSGTGPFFEIASMSGMSSTDWTWAPRMVDLNNDGKLDVFFTNGHARDIMNADVSNEFSNFGDDEESKAKLEAFYTSIPPRKEANLAFENLGDFEFKSVGESWGLDHKGVSHGAAFSDLDNDGDLDLIVNNFFEQALVYRNESNEGARVIFEFRGNQNNYYGVSTRVEIWQGETYANRTLRSNQGYLSSDAPTVHFGCKDTNIDRVRITWPDQTTQEYTDLAPGFVYRVIEADQREKLIIPQAPAARFADVAEEIGLQFTHQERDYDDFARENLLPYKLSELGAGLAWGDVNKDGFPDLYCGGAAGQSGKLFVNENGKSFKTTTGPWEKDKAAEDMGSLFFDADGDGDQDLYVVSGGNECDPGDSVLQDRLYLNVGDGTFERSVDSLPATVASGSSVSACDFDRDGDLDLFVGSRAIPGKYPQTPTSQLLQNENGKFIDVSSSHSELTQAGLVNSAIWTDFDADGWTDLILALDWGPITFFKNNEGQFENVTSKLKVEGLSGWWHGVTSVDLDDDGDLDLVATNMGLNTKYHVDLEHPHRLYYFDFDDSGTLDLVETEFEGDTEFPARGRSCSSNSMPFIADKFPTYHDFALASLTEIYEPSIKDKPSRQVNYLESSVFWNRQSDSGEHYFEVTPLPREAQFSPAFGIVAEDFNLDSQIDLFVANNFFASQPETGFMDGGLSLLLDGTDDGEFESVWPTQSGVAINEAAYGAAAADWDLDGDLDVAVSVNNGRLRAFKNSTRDDKSSSSKVARIRWTGADGNRNAIGAKLLLRGEGFTRIIQTKAGGSYLSASTTNSLLLPVGIAKRIQEIEVTWPDGSTKTYAANFDSEMSLELNK